MAAKKKRSKRVSPDGRSHRERKHARLYYWEMESEAYRSLSCYARALLIEFRMLYNGDNNGEIYMGVRQMMRALNVGQKAAVKARDELVDRGFIRLTTEGSFKLKVRHATEWAITNEPVGSAILPTKEYMSWQPAQKNTVSLGTTDGKPTDYRCGIKEPKKEVNGKPRDYRKAEKEEIHGKPRDYTTSLPGAICFPVSPLPAFKSPSDPSGPKPKRGVTS